jgi:hypothetical protein
MAFFRRQSQKHKTRQPARLAYIYPKAFQGRILQAFLVLQRFMPQRVTVRFFQENEEDEARAWLNAG